MPGRAFAHPETADDERELSAPRAPEPVRRKAVPLVVGSADDRAEVEADRVAAEVISRLRGGEAGESHVHDGCHGVARTVAPVSGGPEVGRAGGEISEELSSRIEARRGSGSALPDDVRRRMESGFGRSLAAVRVHTGGEAARLNRSISARAFTTGNDIFFGAGEYRPDTAAGEKVLAHELAHTQQQGAGARRVHRLAFEGTDFSRVTAIRVFGQGGSKASALVDDGSGERLVVKSSLDVGTENLVAAALHQGMSAKTKGGLFGRGAKKGDAHQTPNARFGTDAEKAALKVRAQALLAGDDDAKNFLDGLDTSKKLFIQELATGKNINDIAKESTTTGAAGGYLTAPGQVNQNHLFAKLMTQGPIVTSLARHAAVDVAVGMHDRLIRQYNGDNFMWDEASQSFSFVDNAKDSDYGRLLTHEGAQGRTVTTRDALGAWAQQAFVKDLAEDPARMAKGIVDRLEADTGWAMGKNAMAPKRSPESVKALQAAFAAAGVKDRMTAWTAAGLKDGRKRIFSLLKNPTPLVAGLPVEDRHDAARSLVARGLVLQGVDIDKAWARAGAVADKLFPATPKKTKGKTAKPAAGPGLPPLPAVPNVPAWQPPKQVRFAPGTRG
jgi:hypothetical protein